jgi:hypothetical protein
MFTISKHAREKIQVRKIASEREVLTALDKKTKLIKIAGNHVVEVRVIVKRLSAVVYCPDGSNGNIVVACIDTRNNKVKTIMLTNTYQIKKKMKTLMEVRYI